jgi:hypothetical protein
MAGMERAHRRDKRDALPRRAEGGDAFAKHIQVPNGLHVKLLLDKCGRGFYEG